MTKVKNKVRIKKEIVFFFFFNKGLPFHLTFNFNPFIFIFLQIIKPMFFLAKSRINLMFIIFFDTMKSQKKAIKNKL